MGWSDDLVTENSQVDSQHQLLFALFDKIDAELDLSDIPAILAEIVHYVATHFSDEERIMEMEEYADFEMHKELHRKIIAELKVIETQSDEGKLSSWIRIQRFLKRWLANHVVEKDMKFSQFVKMKHRE